MDDSTCGGIFFLSQHPTIDPFALLQALQLIKNVF
jgi:hypothetical protein